MTWQEGGSPWTAMVVCGRSGRSKSKGARDDYLVQSRERLVVICTLSVFKLLS